ncbi:MAG: dUTP diphosphatase [Clostridia bacterium]|nr:dUTP diphosphatase [Clostridia bacterium]
MSIARFARISDAQYQQDAAAYAVKLPLAELPLPCRATTGSAGYDFVCPVEVTMRPGDTAVIPTGIRCFMEPGWVLLNCPRSSLGRKHGIRLANTVGVIDSDYVYADNEGHILVMLVNGGDHEVTLHPGERFCQGIFLPYGLADEAEVTGERSGGFGSTGK